MPSFFILSVLFSLLFIQYFHYKNLYFCESVEQMINQKRPVVSMLTNLKNDGSVYFLQFIVLLLHIVSLLSCVSDAPVSKTQAGAS